jgi:threonine/homoserine/homoserine lactone efflux protein
MPLHLWLAFVAASALLLVLPGPTTLTIVSTTLAHGRRACVPLVAGVALGDTAALVVSLLGLGSLLAASAFWFTVIKWIGGLYLLWLGSRMLLAGAAGAAVEAAAVPQSRRRVFANTVLVTAFNPKLIVFFVAFLPQFVDAHGDTVRQLSLLGTTFVAMAILNSTLFALFAASARSVLASPRARRSFHLAGGSMLSAAGIWALMARRPA